MDDAPRTYRRILLFWLPLLATWLMMAVEGPFIAAVIARMPEAKANLAAYGVAFSFAMVVESPIIMMLSASVALVRGRASYRALRNFSTTLNAGITVVMLVLLLPPVFRLIAEGGIGLPDDVARRTHHALLLLLPWPAAIGFRRFAQGLLIANHRTRMVAYGTVVRLLSMAGTALALHAWGGIDGAVVGAAALAAGVTGEALASRLMTLDLVRRYRAGDIGPADERAPSFREMWRFYLPLALTSMLAIGVHPMTTFFLGQGRMALESLAVMPVVNSTVFFFRAFGLSYQEVVVALVGRGREAADRVLRFARGLGVAATAGLAVLAFSPAGPAWLTTVSGLPPDLAALALDAIRILVLMPATSVLLATQRALLVQARRTPVITRATGIEIACIACVLATTVFGLHWVGAIGAATALMAGRLASNGFLLPPAMRAARGLLRGVSA